MGFIMVNTTNKIAEQRIWDWSQARDRKYIRKHFIRKLGPGTYLLNGNAAVLALLHDLRSRHNGNVYIYAVESLTDSEIPRNITEVVERCRNEERPLLENDLKGLEKIKMRCSVSLKGSSSE